MKSNTILLVSLITILAACGKDDDPVNPSNPTNSAYLTIVPTIANMAETYSGVVKTFNKEDRMGLYVTGSKGSQNNIPAEYNGSTWDLKEIEGAHTVQAYFPYSAAYEDIDAVPVNVAEQIDYLYSVNTTVTNNVAKLTMKHPMSLVSIKIMKNDYNYEGKVSQLEIEGIPVTGQVNLRTGQTTTTGEPTTYKRTLNYTLDSYNPEKISTIVLPVALANLKEVVFRVIIDGDGYSFSVPTAHEWEAGKEYTYTLNVHATFKPNVLEVIPVDVSYWNTYGKTDRITILDKANQNIRIHSYASLAGKMTIKGEGQSFGGRITNSASTAWEGQWRYGMFDMAGNLVELYQAYHITIPANNYDGGRIPCYVNCAPGQYQILPLLKDKGTDYWYIPQQQFEGLNNYTVLPSSANITPSLRSVKVEGWYDAYSGIASYKLNTPFTTIITVTNRAGVALKGEIKAVWERKLTTDFIPYTIDFLEVSGYNTDQWSDEIGRINIDYSSDVKIKQEEMICTITIDRPDVNMCPPVVRWYFKAEGSTEWILMRCDYDHQFEKMKGVTEFIKGDYFKPDEDCLIYATSVWVNPATNYAGVIIKR